MTEHLTKFADQIVASVAGLLKRNLTPIVERVAAVEAREPVSGKDGAPGPQGEPGSAGMDGAVGEPGQPGPAGQNGEPGPIGPKGDSGPAGERGADGTDGAPGARGEQGAPGPQGEPGPAGSDGQPGMGIAGEKGDPGPAGEKGDPGPTGLTGDRGEPGLIGPSGEKGADGINGKDADPLVVAALVAKAISEIPKPEDGRDGRDGEPGRDAFAIEVLQEIDVNRRYQRGAWARHNGGLWMARAATAGMDGWDCIVDGIAKIGAVQAGDVRSFTLSIATSSGKELALPFSVPVPIYKGIWKEGDEYSRADTTTRDGSTWVLMADGQKGKPGEADSGWVLSCKRGTNGRDGLKGDRGDRGAEGRAGRDLTQLGQDGSKW